MTRRVAAWAQQREAGLPILVRLMIFLVPRVPAGLARSLTWAICLLFVVLPGRPANAASRAYLQRLFGRRPRFMELWRHAATFGLVLVDRVGLLAGRDRDMRIAAEGAELIEDYVRQGRGAVLLGAHFGSFELLRAFERRLPGLKVHYLMYAEHASSSHKLLTAINEDVAERIISLNNGPAAMLAAQERLAEGDFVAFLGDRAPFEGRRSSLAVPFLGAPIRVPASPYIMAMAAGVPIVLCFAPRLGDASYAAHFSPLYDGAKVPREARAARLREMAEAYVQRLEALCRRHPFNWFNFFDVWAGGDDLRGTGADDA